MSGITGSKKLTFVALMAALGNVLSYLSIRLTPLMPSIPLGPVNVSMALDLSHVATFIAAFFGGPTIGGITAMIAGLVAAFEFGFSQGNLLTGFLLPIGKALTGVAAGLLLTKLNVDRDRKMMLVITVLSYIPEGALTAFLFIRIYPVVYGMPTFIATAIAVQILVKAFVEMIVMGVILMSLTGNEGFTGYIRGLIS